MSPPCPRSRIVACLAACASMFIATGGGPAAGNPPTAIDQRVERLAAALSEELAAHGFHVFQETPFVVIGDEEVERVRRRCEGTVRWALARLKSDFFPLELTDPVEIWLLRDESSYRAISRARFDVEPSTPFGYFSSPHGALVINVRTGAGTIVHEMVHCLMTANFPKCPAWLNEGLASLFEQCGDRNGHIWGYPNWRLRRLQVAIREQRLSSLEHLCRLSHQQFYADPTAMHYAQARYLCLYLQETGKLREFFQRFRQRVAGDPSGYQTLRDIWGPDQMVDFQRGWEQFVLGLTFPAGNTSPSSK